MPCSRIFRDIIDSKGRICLGPQRSTAVIPLATTDFCFHSIWMNVKVAVTVHMNDALIDGLRSFGALQNV